jgi:hypothetical protein
MLGSTLANVRNATGTSTSSGRPTAPPAEKERITIANTVHAFNTHGTALVNINITVTHTSYI